MNKILKNKYLLSLLLFITLACLSVSCMPQPRRYSPISREIQEGKEPGTIMHKSCEFELDLSARNGNHIVTSKDKKVEVPPGNYKIEYIKLRKKDKKGRTWSLESKRIGKKILVMEKGIVTLDFGEPLEIEIIRRGTYFQYNIKGAESESYAYVYVGDKKADPFSVKVVNAAGKELTSGKFKYG
ncbi:MAG: hypothetical protein ACLFQV_06410 [Vulcanimicrobiota bacterium]